MTAEQLEKQLQCGAAPIVLDVRSSGEFNSGHIPKAVHAPLPGVARVAATAGSKHDLFVVVCEHGPRALVAKAFLSFCGYRNLQLLEGHMSHWRSSGRPLQGC